MLNKIFQAFFFLYIGTLLGCGGGEDLVIGANITAEDSKSDNTSAQPTTLITEKDQEILDDGTIVKNIRSIIPLNTTFDTSNIELYNNGENISANVNIIGNIDTTKAGKYPITFEFKNENNQVYKRYTKIVVVTNNNQKLVNDKVPTITLKGSDIQILHTNEVYHEEGYQANDFEDGDLTSHVILSVKKI